MLRLNFEKISLLTLFIVLVSVDAFAEYFYIKNYNVEIYVNKNTIINVKEKIKIHFTKPRHGIFRYIPYKYKFVRDNGKQKKEVYGTLNIFDIKTPGFDNKIYKRNGNLVIRIGSSTRYVRGDVIYTILYSVSGAVNFFKDSSWFYYNIIGNGWPVSIRHTHFEIVLPRAKESSKIRYAVYSGYRGSTKQEKDITFENGIFECDINHLLKPHQSVTLLMVFPEGYLASPGFFARLKLLLYENRVVFVPVFTFIFLLMLWLIIGKDEKESIMTYYRPPEGVTPAEAGVLIDDKIDGRDLISLIFYWASKGYLKIEEVDNKTSFFKRKDFVLKKLKDLSDDAKEFEEIIFKGLFPYGVNAVRISSLKDKFYETMKDARRSLDEYVKDQKVYEKGTRAISNFLIFASILVFIYATMQINNGIVSFVSWLLTAVIVFIFGRIMPKKTKKGLKEYGAIRGFKDFIDKVEKDRLRKLLDDDPEYFYNTLSYAVAFGEQKKWASKFSDLVSEPPRWYSGRSAYNHGVFSVYAFSDFINGSISSMTYAFGAKGSSETGGFSGGMGGGFSGGGAGGGGGGSW